MKNFNELRKKAPSGEKVLDKKLDGIKMMVQKNQGKYVAYVDGDILDTYRSKQEAEKAAVQFIKQFRKMK